jgi:hypothetical protein
VLDPGDHAQDGRLSRPVRADQRHDLAGADLQRNPEERLQVSIESGRVAQLQ